MLTPEELEAAILAVTDQVGKAMDMIRGKGMVPVFRCGASGLHLPADYVSRWGELYGIGLGPHPVSETLQTDYSLAPPAITPDIRRIEQIMHPVYVSCAQVDWDFVHPLDLAPAVMAHQDPEMNQRAKIVRDKQLLNPRSSLLVMERQWAMFRKVA